jgi:hypothetical protein
MFPSPCPFLTALFFFSVSSVVQIGSNVRN